MAALRANLAPSRMVAPMPTRIRRDGAGVDDGGVATVTNADMQVVVGGEGRSVLDVGVVANDDAVVVAADDALPELELSLKSHRQKQTRPLGDVNILARVGFLRRKV